MRRFETPPLSCGESDAGREGVSCRRSLGRTTESASCVTGVVSSYKGSGPIDLDLRTARGRLSPHQIYLAGADVRLALTTGAGSSSPRKYFDLSFAPSFRSAAFISGMASYGLL